MAESNNAILGTRFQIFNQLRGVHPNAETDFTVCIIPQSQENQRRWTIIALRNLIFYFWSNIELTWHECSFMSQITNHKEKMMEIFFLT